MGHLAPTPMHALVVALVTGFGCTNDYATVALDGAAATSGAGGAGGQDATGGAGTTTSTSSGSTSSAASATASATSGPGSGGSGGGACPDCEVPLGVSTWIGTYTCNQGLTALDLEITREADDDLTAINSFYAHPDNPGVPSGSFTMAGTYDPASQDVLLDGVMWIDQPNGYNMTDLVGLFAPPTQGISGDVILSGCTTFEVVKQ